MKRLLLLTLLLNSLYVLSQKGKTTIDSVYIESMNKLISLKFDVDNDVESFQFNDGNTSFNITPNIDFKTGLSFNYRFIAFKIGYAPNFFSNNNDDAIKGKTKSLVILTDLYIKNWIQTLEFSKTKGYYLSHFSGDIQLTEDMNYFINDQLETKTFRGSTRYKFNPKFSFKALTTQTEIQRKSAGSFTPGITYKYHKMNNGQTNQKLNTFSTTLTAGYYHTFVLNKKWFIGAGTAPGFGMEFNKLETKISNQTYTSKDHDFILTLDSAIGLGYNSNRFFAGTFIDFIASTRRDNTIIKFDTFRTIFQVFIGYRFKAPKPLEKSVDWIEGKSPF